MDCCVFINSKRQLTNDKFELFISNIESNEYIKLNTSIKNSHLNKERSPSTNIKRFPPSLIKSKENPNGIVVIKMKN